MDRPILENQPIVSVSVLAGGKSSRMGRNKARLRLGRKTMLRHIREIAEGLSLPHRVITRDRVAKCGPLSGIFTALSDSPAKSELFLACDMPFVTPEMLEKLINHSAKGTKPVFTSTGEGVGFPCLLPVACLRIVENQIAREQLSVQQLARACKARTIQVSSSQQSLNVNTPEDFAAAQKLLRQINSTRSKPKNRARPACKSAASS